MIPAEYRKSLTDPQSHRQQPSRGRPPSLHLLTEVAPARPVSTSPRSYQQSQSPFRYVRMETMMNEKGRPDETPMDTISAPKREEDVASSQTPNLYRPSASSSQPCCSHSNGAASSSARSSSHPRAPPSLLAVPRSSLHCDFAHHRKTRLYSLLKPWLPLILYLLTSLGFLLAIALWKEQVFQGLDDLSSWLKADERFGCAVLFFLIFLTTFPPLPLYSTFIVLSGYTFGPWTGALISYWAALAGALVVFVLSRYFFQETICRWLSRTQSVKRVVRAIEKRPKLLFLIRLAPYPYNVMNCLLAASPTLTLRTYATCTALSLFKVIIHTTLGSSIHSFAEYHVKPRPESASDGEEESTLAHYSTIAGIVLCVGIFVYLSYVARKAVNEELEDDVLPTHTDEEAIAFLSPGNDRVEEEEEEEEREDDGSVRGVMSEMPFRAATPTSSAAALSGIQSHPLQSAPRNSNGGGGWGRKGRGGNWTLPS
ncbi:hypothetical protein EW146_g8955 [Bondarzewia mesenterica]|uniref:Golgi apparatus membrane protein TVP38 n=1 Tax=Bondarzewia mesenterica TaxID=1095465 RepID=A0A4S4LFK8_9AGAM|nr:hypothetical protein EW146_g8955 [Bondarzewia mesenterica]